MDIIRYKIDNLNSSTNSAAPIAHMARQAGSIIEQHAASARAGSTITTSSVPASSSFHDKALENVLVFPL